ncbi:MAG TPA: hypothetical protein VH682_03195 [Gemmataceae bacterium]|jgi:hypothetical protein
MKYETCDKPSPKTRQGWCGLFVVSLGLLTMGCSSKGDVSGKVSYQGKPLPARAVTFFPSSGEGAFSSRIEMDGSYRMEKVPVGKVKIVIVPFEQQRAGPKAQPKTQAKVQAMAQAVKSGKVHFSEEGRKKMPPGFKEALEDSSSPEGIGSIPAQYTDPEKSVLEYTVTGGEQTHDIELK